VSDPKELKQWASNPPRNALVELPREGSGPDPSREDELPIPEPPKPAAPTHVQVMQAPSHNPIGKMGTKFTGPRPMAKAGKAGAAKGGKGAARAAKAWARSKGKKVSHA
jgi:hypothetical protein